MTSAGATPCGARRRVWWTAQATGREEDEGDEPDQRRDRGDDDGTGTPSRPRLGRRDDTEDRALAAVMLDLAATAAPLIQVHEPAT